MRKTLTLIAVLLAALLGMAQLNMVSVNQIIGTLGIGKGGTGVTTLTNHGIVLGQGANALAATAACGTGTLLYGQGASADPVCSTTTWPNSATQGDLIVATGANAMGSVADVATGQVLTSGGASTVPAYSANPSVTGSYIAPQFKTGSTSNDVMWRINGTNTWIARRGDDAITLNITGDVINGATGFQVGGAAASGNYLIGNGTNYVSKQPVLAHAQPADQTARSSSGGVFVMMGLGAAAAPCTITPNATGRVIFTISGNLVNNTTATTISVKMAESTGAAPANNAAASGTVISRTVVGPGVASALTMPFSITSTQTGLALGTAVWFDLQLTTSSTNTGQPTNVDCTANEI